MVCRYSACISQCITSLVVSVHDLPLYHLYPACIIECKYSVYEGYKAESTGVTRYARAHVDIDGTAAASGVTANAASGIEVSASSVMRRFPRRFGVERLMNSIFVGSLVDAWRRAMWRISRGFVSCKPVYLRVRAPHEWVHRQFRR
jgi:hypothetical protein